MLVRTAALAASLVDTSAPFDHADRPAGAPPKISWLPRILRDPTAIEAHMLARIAVHSWSREDVPYYPPNEHQRAVALALSAAGVRLVTYTPGDRPSFRLSRLGERVARRVLRLVPADVDQRRESEFDRMRALMRNDWEVTSA